MTRLRVSFPRSAVCPSRRPLTIRNVRLDISLWRKRLPWLWNTATNIRVLSLNPAIVGPDIEAALSKFDDRWETSMTWTTTDQPTQGLSSFQNGDQAVFNSSLLKPLPTGGVAGITFNTTYQNLTVPPANFQFT